MTKIKISLIALAAVLATSVSASAADLYAQTPVASWDGFYAGVIGSGGMFNNSSDDQWCYTACDAPELNGFGWGVGGTIGYNHQISNLVIGIEADMSWSSFSNSETYSDVDGGGWKHSASWDYYGTARARIGYSLGDAMFFTSAGVAWADWASFDECTAPFCSFQARAESSGVELGFAVGGGMEYALNESMSLKAEYLYIGMPHRRLNLDTEQELCSEGECDITVNSSVHMARIGLNFHF